VLGLSAVVFILGNLLLSGALLVLAIMIGRQHARVVAGNMRNTPPVLARPIGDLQVDSGRITEFIFTNDTFGDEDEGDALRYTAFLNNSDQLPAWVEFNGLQRKFTFRPGAKEGGRISLRLVARDYDGLSTESRFDVHVVPAEGSGCD
jgi:hypothetical protein